MPTSEALDISIKDMDRKWSVLRESILVRGKKEIDSNREQFDYAVDRVLKIILLEAEIEKLKERGRLGYL